MRLDRKVGVTVDGTLYCMFCVNLDNINKPWAFITLHDYNNKPIDCACCGKQLDKAERDGFSDHDDKCPHLDEEY